MGRHREKHVHQLPAFENFPSFMSLGGHKLMSVRHVQDLCCVRAREWVAAQYDHLAIAKRFVQRPFVLRKVIPIFLGEPRFVRIHPHAGIA